MRFGWVKAHRQEYPLALVCRVLGVSRSGYYAWEGRRGREQGPRQKRREGLAEQIRRVPEGSRRAYGSPRV